MSMDKNIPDPAALLALQDVLLGTQEIIVTVDPDFVDLALDELRAADPDIAVGRVVAPGVLLVSGELSFAQLAARWSEHPPIFIRHICPVLVADALAGETSDLDLLEAHVAAELVAFVSEGFPFSVQTRVFGDLAHKPFDVNRRLADLIADAVGAPLDVKNPAQIVSVVCVGGATPVAYIGLSLVYQNLSDWAGGMRRFARDAGQISRSEFKLLEALEVFGIDLPPRGVALDLGAAPGGWTRILRRHSQYVTAIDPADLDARLAKDAGVRHKRMTAEAYLADEPDHFDLIVNDMRMDARDSARLMVQYAALLYRHGAAVMTLKLPHQKRAGILDQSMRILEQVYEIQGARQLFHNRSEITLYLRPKQDGRRQAE